MKGNNMKRNIVWQIGLTVVLATSIIIGSGCGSSGGGGSGSSVVYEAIGITDTAFGTLGVVTTTIGTSSSYVYNTLIQSDGKIILTGTSSDSGGNNYFTLARYTTAGALDTTFDTDGIVTTTIGPNNNINTSVIQADGKIIAAGYGYVGGGNAYFAMARYTTAGALDTTFDTDGIVTTTIGTDGDYARDIALQPDGKIILAGQSNTGSLSAFALARYTITGTLDTTFGTAGVVTSTFELSNNPAGVAVQPDGKILVGGNCSDSIHNSFALARYTASGVLDTTFGANGVVTTTLGTSDCNAYDMVRQADGKIVMGGYANSLLGNDFALLRYTASGAIDTAFGTNGVVTTTAGVGNDHSLYRIVLQSNGKIVVSGYAESAISYDIGLVRYNANGTLDATFNSDGILNQPVGSGQSEGYDLAIQADGKIVVGGYARFGSYDCFTVVRFK
jgi:uncharacterized delta-60 repeat protein